LKEREEPKPLRCHRCGCQKIYKNGTLKINPKRFLDLLKLNKEKEVTIQKFICAYCRQSLYLKDKDVFFGGQVDRELERNDWDTSLGWSMQSKKYPDYLKEDIQNKIIPWFHLPGSQASLQRS